MEQQAGYTKPANNHQNTFIFINSEHTLLELTNQVAEELSAEPKGQPKGQHSNDSVSQVKLLDLGFGLEDGQVMVNSWMLNHALHLVHDWLCKGLHCHEITKGKRSARVKGLDKTGAIALHFTLVT